jgi:hypothetical protein
MPNGVTTTAPPSRVMRLTCKLTFRRRDDAPIGALARASTGPWPCSASINTTH